jgi:hypothetical protein
MILVSVIMSQLPDAGDKKCLESELAFVGLAASHSKTQRLA